MAEILLPGFAVHLMIQALAYRLQEKVLGQLKPATRRLLQRVAGDARGPAHRCSSQSTALNPARC